jgi:glutathione S-transferase
MNTTDTSMTIVQEITIAAPAAKVFAALTVPEQTMQWWGHEDSYRLTKMEQDFRIGGAWRTVGSDNEGHSFSVKGTYRAIEPPHLLEYTWLYDWGPLDDKTETVVRFELDERDGLTHVRLTHSGFTDPESKADHERGWTTVLGWLRDYVQ